MASPSEIKLRLAAVLAVGLLPAWAGAAKFELVEEWPAVAFDDNGKNVIVFLHMADLDVPELDKRGPSAAAPELYVPLYELSLKKARRKDGNPDGDVETVSFLSRPTAYRLYVRLDPQSHRHVIKRDPDFRTEVGGDLGSLLNVFHLPAAKPENVLVRVQPGAAPAQADALNDIETAAIASMDGPERAAAASECGGQPGAPGTAACWRAKAHKLLASHTEAAPGGEISAFEQRYLKQRLSAKGYAQFQRAMELPMGNAQRSALLRDWDESILSLDLKDFGALPAKTTDDTTVAQVPAVPAAVSAATTSATASAAVSTATAAVTPVLRSVAPITKAAPRTKAKAPATPALAPGAPKPAPEQNGSEVPARYYWLQLRRLTLGTVLIFVMLYLLARRKKRGKR